MTPDERADLIARADDGADGGQHAVRGVDLADGIRSAPGGGTMDKMSEWFVGGNYYFKGDNVKLQLGYIHGESKDTVTGGAVANMGLWHGIADFDAPQTLALVQGLLETDRKSVV